MTKEQFEMIEDLRRDASGSIATARLSLKTAIDALDSLSAYINAERIAALRAEVDAANKERAL